MSGENSFQEFLESPEKAKDYIQMFHHFSTGYELPDPKDLSEDEAIDIASDLMHMVLDDLRISEMLKSMDKLT